MGLMTLRVPSGRVVTVERSEPVRAYVGDEVFTVRPSVIERITIEDLNEDRSIDFTDRDEIDAFIVRCGGGNDEATIETAIADALNY